MCGMLVLRNQRDLPGNILIAGRAVYANHQSQTGSWSIMQTTQNKKLITSPSGMATTEGRKQNKTNPATKKCDTTTSDQNRLWNETGKSGRGKNFFFFSALHSVGQQLILGCCVFTFFVFLPLLFFHLFDSHPILFFMSAGRVSAVPPQGLARIPPKPRPLLHKLVQFKSRFFALLSAVRVCVCYSRKNMSASRGAVPDVNHFIRAPHFPFTNLFFFSRLISRKRATVKTRQGSERTACVEEAG